jgi:hypothetical protein
LAVLEFELMALRLLGRHLQLSHIFSPSALSSLSWISLDLVYIVFNFILVFYLYNYNKKTQQVSTEGVCVLQKIPVSNIQAMKSA